MGTEARKHRRPFHLFLYTISISSQNHFSSSEEAIGLTTKSSNLIYPAVEGASGIIGLAKEGPVSTSIIKLTAYKLRPPRRQKTPQHLTANLMSG